MNGVRVLVTGANSFTARFLLPALAARSDETPVTERTPPRPLSPYGVSKAAAELYALSVHRQHAVRVVVMRPFNLLGPGLRAGMAPSDFVAQAVAIRDRHASPELHVG